MLQTHNFRISQNYFKPEQPSAKESNSKGKSRASMSHLLRNFSVENLVTQKTPWVKTTNNMWQQ